MLNPPDYILIAMRAANPLHGINTADHDTAAAIAN